MRPRAFTLVELLVVVAIVSILAVIGVVNFRLGVERSLRASNASNLHTVAIGLQSYLVDHGDLPPADREAGPFMSHAPNFVAARNGPAAGGSWDGLPWLLHDLGYVSDWKTLFNPKYMKRYAGGETLRGGHPRFHNFRYAYNSAAAASGGHAGGAGNVMDGTVWIVRDLWLDARSGWFGAMAPEYPADYAYPWGEGDYASRLEHALYADMGVRTVIGGTDAPPTYE